MLRWLRQWLSDFTMSDIYMFFTCCFTFMTKRNVSTHVSDEYSTYYAYFFFIFLQSVGSSEVKAIKLHGLEVWVASCISLILPIKREEKVTLDHNYVSLISFKWHLSFLTSQVTHKKTMGETDFWDAESSFNGTHNVTWMWVHLTSSWTTFVVFKHYMRHYQLIFADLHFGDYVLVVLLPLFGCLSTPIHFLWLARWRQLLFCSVSSQGSLGQLWLFFYVPWPRPTTHRWVYQCQCFCTSPCVSSSVMFCQGSPSSCPDILHGHPLPVSAHRTEPKLIYKQGKGKTKNFKCVIQM